MKPTCRKSWAKNLLMWSDFTLGSSFKVKPWLIGFGEFSFWWIRFASVLRCARSSLCWHPVCHLLPTIYRVLSVIIVASLIEKNVQYYCRSKIGHLTKKSLDIR